MHTLESAWRPEVLARHAQSDAKFVLQTSLKIVQDYFYMRHRLPFDDQVHTYAKAVCRERKLGQPLVTESARAHRYFVSNLVQKTC